MRPQRGASKAGGCDSARRPNFVVACMYVRWTLRDEEERLLCARVCDQTRGCRAATACRTPEEQRGSRCHGHGGPAEQVGLGVGTPFCISARGRRGEERGAKSCVRCACVCVWVGVWAGRRGGKGCWGGERARSRVVSTDNLTHCGNTPTPPSPPPSFTRLCSAEDNGTDNQPPGIAAATAAGSSTDVDSAPTFFTPDSSAPPLRPNPYTLSGHRDERGGREEEASHARATGVSISRTESLGSSSGGGGGSGGNNGGGSGRDTLLRRRVWARHSSTDSGVSVGMGGASHQVCIVCGVVCGVVFMRAVGEGVGETRC